MTQEAGEDIQMEAKLLDPEGVIGDQDFTGYFEVIFSAFEIYVERDGIRHGLWKEYPAHDQMRTVKIKTDRIMRSLETEPMSDAQRENVLEELKDVINYAVFATRLVQGTV